MTGHGTLAALRVTGPFGCEGNREFVRQANYDLDRPVIELGSRNCNAIGVGGPEETFLSDSGARFGHRGLASSHCNDER